MIRRREEAAELQSLSRPGMDMDGWRDILHFDLHGEHVLVSALRLSSVFDFMVASLLTVALCALEKCVPLFFLLF